MRGRIAQKRGVFLKAYEHQIENLRKCEWLVSEMEVRLERRGENQQGRKGTQRGREGESILSFPNISNCCDASDGKLINYFDYLYI